MTSRGRLLGRSAARGAACAAGRRRARPARRSSRRARSCGSGRTTTRRDQLRAPAMPTRPRARPRVAATSLGSMISIGQQPPITTAQRRPGGARRTPRRARASGGRSQAGADAGTSGQRRRRPRRRRARNENGDPNASQPGGSGARRVEMPGAGRDDAGLEPAAAPRPGPCSRRSGGGRCAPRSTAGARSPRPSRPRPSAAGSPRGSGRTRRRRCAGSARPRAVCASAQSCSNVAITQAMTFGSRTTARPIFAGSLAGIGSSATSRSMTRLRPGTEVANRILPPLSASSVR